MWATEGWNGFRWPEFCSAPLVGYHGTLTFRWHTWQYVSRICTQTHIPNSTHRMKRTGGHLQSTNISVPSCRESKHLLGLILDEDGTQCNPIYAILVWPRFCRHGKYMSQTLCAALVWQKNVSCWGRFFLYLWHLNRFLLVPSIRGPQYKWWFSSFYSQTATKKNRRVKHGGVSQPELAVLLMAHLTSMAVAVITIVTNSFKQMDWLIFGW